MPEPALPRVALTPTQWVRFHWRYTTADNWGRISKKRAPLEKPIWMEADLGAMAIAAETLGETELAQTCREVSIGQDWARARLSLSETWKAHGGRKHTLDNWLLRQRLKILDDLVKRQ